MPTLPIAAPSFVIPAGVAENARFLAHKVQEVGLCFFESKSCLAYTDEDLPLDLQALPLRWHVHLPMDLPWAVGSHAQKLNGQKAAQTALEVFAKAAHLAPRCAVLHPPNFTNENEQVRLLQEFADVWYKKSKAPLLLENIQDDPLYTLPESLFQPRPAGLGFGICLDIGHMLTFGQETILQHKGLLKRVRMVHWSAPGEEALRDRHASLHELSPKQVEIITDLMPHIPNECTHMIEVFRWKGIETSMPTLKRFLESKAW